MDEGKEQKRMDKLMNGYTFSVDIKLCVYSSTGSGVSGCDVVTS
jgi:hypothetical protein